MAFSQVTYTGDGVTKDFTVTFAYLDQSHVVARINKVFTTDGASGFNQEFIDSTTLRVTKKISGDPPDNGDEITIIRQTPIATPAVVFGGGASLSSANLNKNSEYLTYALQEATDANDAFTKIYLGAFAAAPTVDNDGEALIAGALYYDTVVESLYYYTGTTWLIAESTAAAETFKNAAEAAKTAAELAQSLAEAAQAAAEAAKTGAETAQTGAQTAETGALAAQTASEAALDAFTDLYLGNAASDPTVDLDGNPLQTGALYFNTTTNDMKVYNGATWQKLTLDALLASNNLSDLASTVTALVNLGILDTSFTGGIVVPAGTTAQRPGTPVGRLIRFNTTSGAFEGWSGSAWVPVGGGGLFKGDNGVVGTAPGDIFRINNATLTVNTTIDADENASATGPLTVDTGVTLTVNGNLAII